MRSRRGTATALSGASRSSVCIASLISCRRVGTQPNRECVVDIRHPRLASKRVVDSENHAVSVLRHPEYSILCRSSPMRRGPHSERGCGRDPSARTPLNRRVAYMIDLPPSERLPRGLTERIVAHGMPRVTWRHA